MFLLKRACILSSGGSVTPLCAAARVHWWCQRLPSRALIIHVKPSEKLSVLHIYGNLLVKYISVHFIQLTRASPTSHHWWWEDNSTYLWTDSPSEHWAKECWEDTKIFTDVTGYECRVNCFEVSSTGFINKRNKSTLLTLHKFMRQDLKNHHS